jgi:hypothetical protein
MFLEPLQENCGRPWWNLDHCGIQPGRATPNCTQAFGRGLKTCFKDDDCSDLILCKHSPSLLLIAEFKKQRRNHFTMHGFNSVQEIQLGYGRNELQDAP